MKEVMSKKDGEKKGKERIVEKISDHERMRYEEREMELCKER